MKIQPAHQTTGNDSPNCSQLARGIATGIDTPGRCPASTVTGTVNSSASQKRRRMSASIILAWAGSAIIAEWS
jgi:hypothetical protein